MSAGLHGPALGLALGAHSAARWRPEGATLALDFVARRYARGNATVTAGELFEPGGTALRFAGASHADQPGLLCESGDVYRIATAGWWNPVEGTVLCEVSAPNNGVNQSIWDFHKASDGWGEKWLGQWNIVRWNTTVRSAAQNSGNIQTGAHARPARIAASIGNGTLRLYVNGVKLSEVATAIPQGIGRLRLGSVHTDTNPLNGVIRRFIYWPSRLSDDDAMTLSA